MEPLLKLEAGADPAAAVSTLDQLIASGAPATKPAVELCLGLAQNQELEAAVRARAVTFLGEETRRKPRAMVKQKLQGPMVAALFSVLAAQELGAGEELDGEEEEAGSPALAASRSLDLLALHLPPASLLPAVLGHARPALASLSPAHQRAAYQALAVTTEGCADTIRSGCNFAKSFTILGVVLI